MCENADLCDLFTYVIYIVKLSNNMPKDVKFIYEDEYYRCDIDTFTTTGAVAIRNNNSSDLYIKSYFAAVCALLKNTTLNYLHFCANPLYSVMKNEELLACIRNTTIAHVEINMLHDGHAWYDMGGNDEYDTRVHKAIIMNKQIKNFYISNSDLFNHTKEVTFVNLLKSKEIIEINTSNDVLQWWETRETLPTHFLSYDIDIPESLPNIKSISIIANKTDNPLEIEDNGWYDDPENNCIDKVNYLLRKSPKLHTFNFSSANHFGVYKMGGKQKESRKYMEEFRILLLELQCLKIGKITDIWVANFAHKLATDFNGKELTLEFALETQVKRKRKDKITKKTKMITLTKEEMYVGTYWRVINIMVKRVIEMENTIANVNFFTSQIDVTRLILSFTGQQIPKLTLLSRLNGQFNFPYYEKLATKIKGGLTKKAMSVCSQGKYFDNIVIEKKKLSDFML